MRQVRMQNVSRITFPLAEPVPYENGIAFLFETGYRLRRARMTNNYWMALSRHRRIMTADTDSKWKWGSSTLSDITLASLSNTSFTLTLRCQLMGPRPFVLRNRPHRRPRSSGGREGGRRKQNILYSKERNNRRASSVRM